jgi:hypothetical protein
VQNLLGMFSEEEQKFSKLGVKDLYKLKYVYDSAASEGYTRMQFELKSIFSLIESLEPKEMKIMIDDIYKKLEKLEFNPTISGPNISFKDKLGRDFSVWYKPTFYIPTVNSARECTVDFVIMRGVHGSMYELDPELKKQLYSYEFLSNTMLKDISIRLLGKLKHIGLGIICKKTFMPSDLGEIKIASYYLKANKLMLLSDNYMPDNLKMSVPVNVLYAEKVDMNPQKFVDIARRVL